MVGKPGEGPAVIEEALGKARVEEAQKRLTESRGNRNSRSLSWERWGSWRASSAVLLWDLNTGSQFAARMGQGIDSMTYSTAVACMGLNATQQCRLGDRSPLIALSCLDSCVRLSRAGQLMDPKPKHSAQNLNTTKFGKCLVYHLSLVHWSEGS